MLTKTSLKDNILKYGPEWKILLIFLIFFLLRLNKLGYHDFWYDEVASVNYAYFPWSNWNVPLYWILLHFWIKIFSFSEFSLRFPSLIFNFLSIVLVFLLGKKLFNKKIGIIASIFIGLSPFHLWYAQEARDYSMVLFLGTFAFYLLFKAIEKGEIKFWLLFAFISLIGIYTNYFFALLLFTQALGIIFFKKVRLNFKVVACFLIIALGFSFYLPRFLEKFYYIWYGFWVPKPTWQSLIITLENYILGYSGFPLLYLISDLLLVLLFISLFWVLRRKELRQNLILCMFLFIFPIICVFCFSKTFFSIYLDRALILFSPYFYLVLAVIIGSLNKALRAVSLILLIAISFIAINNYFKDSMSMPLAHHMGTYIKKPIRPVVKFFKDNIESQDIVAFTNESVMRSFIFYRKESYPLYYFFDPVFPNTSWHRPVFESNFVVPLKKINLLKAKRIWVISSDWARNGELDDNSRSVKNWMDSNFKRDFSKEFDGLWVFMYIK